MSRLSFRAARSPQLPRQLAEAKARPLAREVEAWEVPLAVPLLDLVVGLDATRRPQVRADLALARIPTDRAPPLELDRAPRPRPRSPTPRPGDTALALGRIRPGLDPAPGHLSPEEVGARDATTEEVDTKATKVPERRAEVLVTLATTATTAAAGAAAAAGILIADDKFTARLGRKLGVWGIDGFGAFGGLRKTRGESALLGVVCFA